MDGNDFFRLYDFHSMQEIGKIGVVGEGYRGMGAVAKFGGGINGPSGHHAGAGIGNLKILRLL